MNQVITLYIFCERFIGYVKNNTGPYSQEIIFNKPPHAG